MTDDATKANGPETSSPADDSFAWTEPEPTTGGTGQAREWVAQLQAMIERIATQSAPVIREVGAKAAELAALAGEKAGPVAQRAAEFTGKAGEKLAEKSRDLAAELRRDAAAAAKDAEAAAGTTTTAGESMSDEPTASGVG
jgi:hypothetical protein